MAAYGFYECSSPSCRLRFPLDKGQYKGTFCLRCGGLLREIPSEVERKKVESCPVVAVRQILGILDNIRSAHNVGGIFRTADGVGVTHLYLCGITPTPEDHPEIAKTGLGAEQAVPWSAHPNALAEAERLKEEGVFLIGLERHPDATSIQTISMANLKGRPVGLIVGHERAGVDPGLLAMCDEVISLPMVGRKASLNVSVAFGVAAYWLAFQ